MMPARPVMKNSMRRKLWTCWSIWLTPGQSLVFSCWHSVTNLDQLGCLLETVQLFARCFFLILLDVGDETIRVAFQLRHQFLHDGVARFLARRIPLNRYFHLVLVGAVLVIDPRLFRHFTVLPSLPSN